MNKNVKSLFVVDNWLKHNLLYNPSSSTMVNEIYKIYSTDMVNKGKVPYSKREFCNSMRKWYENDQETNKVRILNRSRGLIIQGVYYHGELNVQH